MSRNKRKEIGDITMFDLKGKVALITGATGGIGGAIAHKMKEAGATVVVSCRNVAKLNS